MTVITLVNVRGGGALKRNALNTFKREINPDLMIVSETKTLSPNDVNGVAAWNSYGVAIIVKDPKTITIHKNTNIHHSLLQRIIHFTFTSGTLSLNTLAIYGPAEQQERPKFWPKVHTSFPSNIQLIAGDLNISESRSQHLAALLKAHSLIDAAVALDDHTPTFQRSGQDEFTKRLDRFLIHDPLRSRLKHISYRTHEGLDHKIVTLYLDELPPPTIPRHRPPVPKGKLAAVIEMLNHSKLTIPPRPGPAEWKRFKTTLKRTLAALAATSESDSDSALRIELQNAFNTKAFQLNDIPRRRLAILKSQRAAQQAFTSIRTGPAADQTTSSVDGMLEATHKFYSDLYGRRDTNLEALQHLLVNVPRTDPSKLCHLDDPISEDEVTQALSEMNPWKAPGPDSIHSAALKTLSESIAPSLCHLFNCFLTGLEIPKDFKSGITSLLMKKGDPADLANRRPITLLSSDYKCMSKVLTNRLKTVISDLIDDVQSGFIPNRYILNNVLAADLAFREFPEIRMYALDFQKAYDSVSHLAIKTIMDHMNFPPRFTKLIQEMINGSSTRCIVNGFLTDHVALNRGVKQGDPISPLLFNIAIEPLARTIKATLAQKSYPRILLYADDASLFFEANDADSENDMQKFKSALELTAEGIGLMINKNKCLTIAKEKHALDPFPHTQSERYLGYTMTYRGVDPDTFPTIVEKARGTLALWKQSGSSPTSNAAIIKTFALSKTFYAAILSPIPKSCNVELQDMCDWFLWGKDCSSPPSRRCHQRRRMSLHRACMDTRDGGLQMFAFPERFIALKAAFLLKLVQHTPSWLVPLISKHLRSEKTSPLGNKKLSPPAAVIATTSPLLGCIKAWNTCSRSNHDEYGPEIKKLIPTIDAMIKGEKFDNNPTPLTTKSLYRAITSFPPILTERQIGIEKEFGIKLSNYWANRNRIPALYPQRRIIEMFFNSTLPYRKGRVKCSLCDNTLTRVHIFFECPMAVRIADATLKKLQRFWNPKDPPLWNAKEVLTTFTSPTTNLELTTSYAITFGSTWLAWCKATYEEEPFSINRIVKTAKLTWKKCFTAFIQPPTK